MSCESRHRAIVTDLLSLAGLHETSAVDAVMEVGVAHRHHYQRGRLPTPAAVPVSLHADARRALDITGHSDQAIPSWVSSLVTLLDGAADRGSRRALLTLRWLTGGGQDVTPLLTGDDRGWLMAARRFRIQIPQAWRDRVLGIRPTAVVGRLFSYPVMGAVVITEILDVLIGIDDIPPDAGHAVTPQHVLRLLFNQPLASRTDLQHVLRAVLQNAPVVRDIVTRLDTQCGSKWPSQFPLPLTLLGSAARTRGCSVEQAGVDGVLSHVADQIRKKTGRSIDPTALRDPSPAVIQTIINLLRDGWHGSSYLDGPSLTALMHSWETSGRNDATEQVAQTLAQILAEGRMGSDLFSSTVAPIIAGVVPPPHGDALVAQLDFASIGDAWPAMTAGAVYAAACHRIGYVPTIAGMADRIRTQWVNRWNANYIPSPIPLRAVGREQELLPVLHTARGTAAWRPLILDCIDAMDTLDAVGGDPQALLAVLADALTISGGTLDPQIGIRLAASRYGQTLLSGRPTVDTPSGWTDPPVRRYAHRLIPHLVSPWWATAPPHLREWWETAIRHAVEQRYTSLLSTSTPLYPTVIPQAAVLCRTPDLVRRAIGHSQWATIPEADRRACLRTVVRNIRQGCLLQLMMHATTDTVLEDMVAALSAVGGLSETDTHAGWWIIGAIHGGEHEL